MVEQSAERVILEQKQEFDPSQIANELEVGVEVVRAAIDNLRSRGFSLVDSGGRVVRSRMPIWGEVYDVSSLVDPKHLHFGVMGDTHLADKKERTDLLNKYYDTCEAEGIKLVLNVGDLTTGTGVYRGQEVELKCFGQEDQIQYAIDNYPARKGITTVAISGNHDLRGYETGGVDPLVQIAARRKDIVYIGQMWGKADMHGVQVELLHPSGKQAYALSYKPQRAINARTELPDVLAYGHYHTAFYMYYRGVHFLQAPCFKDEGIFEKRNGFNSVLGGWIVEATIGENGRLDKFKPELLTYK